MVVVCVCGGGGGGGAVSVQCNSYFCCEFCGSSDGGVGVKEGRDGGGWNRITRERCVD